MTLYINACPREESRTERLARAYLARISDVTELNRSEQNFQKVLSSPEYAPQFAMAMSYISSLSRKNREK